MVGYAPAWFAALSTLEWARGGSVDERTFELIRRIRSVSREMPRLTLAEFKALVREQYFMLLIDEEAALAAIPSMLPASVEEREQALAVLRDILSARGEVTGEAASRLKRDRSAVRRRRACRGVPGSDTRRSA